MSDTVTEAAAEQKTDEAKTYSEEQFKGLLADKQSEVKKRQAIETELADLRSKQTQDPPTGKIEVESEDAPMTVSQFKKMLAEERQTDSDARFNALEKETISEVKQNLTAEAKGEGLDFDSVVAAGEANLSEGDKLAIRQSKNPALEKYRRCIFNTPDLNDKAEAFRTAKLLENIKLNGRVPGTGGNASTANAKDISSMSAEELDKLAADME